MRGGAVSFEGIRSLYEKHFFGATPRDAGGVAFGRAGASFKQRPRRRRADKGGEGAGGEDERGAARRPRAQPLGLRRAPRRRGARRKTRRRGVHRAAAQPVEG